MKVLSPLLAMIAVTVGRVCSFSRGATHFSTRPSEEAQNMRPPTTPAGVLISWTDSRRKQWRAKLVKHRVWLLA